MREASRVFGFVPLDPISLAAFAAAVDHPLDARQLCHLHAFGASEKVAEFAFELVAIATEEYSARAVVGAPTPREDNLDESMTSF